MTDGQVQYEIKGGRLYASMFIPGLGGKGFVIPYPPKPDKGAKG